MIRVHPGLAPLLLGAAALLPGCGSSGDEPNNSPSSSGGSSAGGTSNQAGGTGAGGGNEGGTGGTSASGGAPGSGGASCDAACLCDADPSSCVVDHETECKLAGLAFGPYIEDGENPGMAISRDQAIERVGLIADATEAIRMYGCVGQVEIARAAQEMGLKVSMAAFMTDDDSANADEIECLIDACNEDLCDAAIVGNEFEFTGATVQQLIDGIGEVRDNIDASIPVTTAVVLGSFAAHPELVNAVDELYVHIYPSLAGYPVEHSMTDMHTAYQSVRAVSGDKPIVISETGWPSSGGLGAGLFGDVSFNEADAGAYLKSFVSWAEQELREQDSYFYFAALDEPWKSSTEGNYGAHWGIATKEILKTGVASTLTCDRVTPSFGAERIPDEGSVGDPIVSTTSVPAIGSEAPICGTSNFIVPADTRISVYVNTTSGWWGPKTFGGTVPVLPDGTWCSHYASPGSGDSDAPEIGVFLVSSAFDPPTVLGAPTLPSTLTDAALDEDIVAR